MKQIHILFSSCTICVEPNVFHFLTTFEDYLFLEYFDTEYSTIDYFPYRNIVDEKIKST